MQDADKTKEQLITELKALRQRVAESERDKRASTDPTELRRRAEEWLKAKQTETDQRETLDTERLYHELATHQIELEMQNEELRNALVQIEESRTKYSDLYDFAPVGYLTLDENGLVLEANLTIARQLGIERSRLVGSPLSAYIVIADRDAFRSHLGSVLKYKTHQACEVRFMKGSGGAFHALLGSIFFEDPGCSRRLRTSVTDITERKLAENLLRESEEQLHVFIEQAPASLAMFDREMRYLSASRRWLSDYNLGERDLRGMSHYEVFPEIPERWKTFHRRGLAGEVVWADTDRFERADGSVQWLRWEIRPWRDTTGDVAGIVIFSEDITERKQAEQAVLQAKEDWERTFDAVPDLIAILDTDYRIVRVNKAMASRLGVPPIEFIGLKCYEIGHGTSGPPVFCPNRQLLGDGIEHTAEIHEERLGGDFLVSVLPLLGPRGELLGSVHVCRDITERKQAEEALLESENKFKSFAEQALAGIYIIQDGVFKYVNPQFAQMFGYAVEECLNDMPFRDLVYAEDQATVEGQVARRTLGEAESVHYTFRGLKKNGQIFHVEVYGATSAYKGKPAATGTILDITERKRMEAKVREHTDFLQTLFDTIPNPVFHKDANGRYAGCNPAFLEFTGRPMEEILGKTVYDLEPKDIADKYEEKDRELFDQPGKQHYEWKIHNALGEIREVIFDKATILDTNAEVSGLIGVISDITERKRAEQALCNKSEELQLILDTVPATIWFKDKSNNFLRVNKATCEMMGFSKADIEGKNAREVFPDWLAEKYYEDDLEVIRSVQSKMGIEEQLTNAAGELRWVRTDKIPWYDEQGNLAGVLAFALDITENKRAEESLRESEAQFRTLVESAPQAIFIQGQGRFAYVNQEAIRLFGAKSQEFLLGQSVIKRFHPDDHAKVLERIRLLNEERKPVPLIEERILKLDGTASDVEVSAVPFRYGEESGALVFVSDITDRKRAEAEKEKVEAQLFQSQKMESVGRLAGGVAHDFNNMLGVIIGRAEMALEQDILTANLKEDLQEILKAGQRSADLTRQLLAFARKQSAIPKILDLNDTISGILKMLRRLIGEDIDLFWAPELDLWKVKIDPSQVDQILANLVVNARDSISGVGAITMRTENVVIDDSVRAETPEFISGEYVLLTISDSGEGMNQEVLENIFEPFFTTKEVGKGTGLGLSTVYGIVKQNDGFIYVASEQGKGTTFKIYLPRLQDETSQVPSKEVAGKRPTGTETILLVEDDEAILNLSKTILEKLGYTVLAARTPVNAMHLVEEHQGDLHLLITDVVMPEMNGRELAEQLSAIRPNLKCIYMSGYTADVIAHRGILEEGVNFIQKPFGSRELAAKVRQVLDQLD
jgi:PAS domain S-box-containing protein